MGNDEIVCMECMYDLLLLYLGCDSGMDWMMFGYYIMNNISIGLCIFVSGLLVGVGILLVLLFNGLIIGVVVGYL